MQGYKLFRCKGIILISGLPLLPLDSWLCAHIGDLTHDLQMYVPLLGADRCELPLTAVGVHQFLPCHHVILTALLERSTCPSLSILMRSWSLSSSFTRALLTLLRALLNFLLIVKFHLQGINQSIYLCHVPDNQINLISGEMVIDFSFLFLCSGLSH